MKNKKANRLINETSPYLLQHAYNPVDWYPWAEEAFRRAEEEDKLIFLSIGYSTCHWCHAMAHDTFENIPTAEYLNKNYISIKVDREERPDIDNAYMLACQILSQQCGWPLNIIMTPDKKPIFAASYLPPIEAYGMRSFVSILEEINEVWKNDKPRVAELGSTVIQRIRIIQEENTEGEVGRNTLLRAYQDFENNFDEEHGGFGREPKFPTPHNLSFLLRWYKTTAEKKALHMVESTLKKMYHGGIFDHVGGGFHRYATDNRWRFPHFEKMLYDQALITNAYLEAYQVTGKQFYADVARRTLDYVLEELTSPEGGFYCGVDADSQGEEGKFYVWSRDEILEILREDAGLFCEFYGISQTGNFDKDKNVLYISCPPKEFAEKSGISLEEVNSKLKSGLKKLQEARNHRPQPHIDDKILTSWNGMMIKAFALGGRVLNEDRYKLAAIRAGEFAMDNLTDANGTLLRSYRKGKSNINGFLEDYAFLAYGFMELYESTYDTVYLKLAIDLTDKMIDEFYDDEAGGFFSSAKSADSPIQRMKDAADQTIPSGNSIAALLLSELADITENISYSELADELFRTFANSINHMPAVYSQFLSALIYSLGKHRVFIVSENPKDAETKDIVNILNKNLLQDSVVLFKQANNSDLEQIHLSAKDKEAKDSKTLIYVCEQNTCKPPLKGKEELASYL